MRGTKYTSYTVEFSGKVDVTLEGRDTDQNYERAKQEAIKRISREFDEDNIVCINVHEYVEPEKDEDR